MLKQLLRNRKGISLAEVVVAMAMLVIVAGAAISVMIASSQADSAYRDKYRALNGCENAVECLRSAEGDYTYVEHALTRAGFVAESDKTTFTLECGSHTVTVAIEDESYAVKYNGETIYVDVNKVINVPID